MKKTNFLTRMLLLFALIVGSTQLWATDTYKKVTSNTEIAEGKEYVLVCESKNVAMKVYASGTYCAGVNVTISNNKVTAVTDINVLTIEEGTNGWYFKQANGNYLYSSAAKSLKAENTTDKTLCTITDDYQIKMGSSGNLQYNASSPRFCPYTSNQTTAYLYVKEEADPTAPSAEISETSLDFGKVNIGETKNLTFTITPANLTANLTIACDNSKYTVTPTSIAQTITTATTITVTTMPTAENDDMSGAITISGGGLADNKTVTLTTIPFDPTNVKEFVKVTDASTLRAGDQLIVVNEEKGNAMGELDGTVRKGSPEVTISEGVISNPGSNIVVVTLITSGENWKLQLGTDKYYKATAAKKTSDATSVEDATEATISISDGDATISFGSTYGALQYNYNSGNPRFTNYTSNQTPVQLYRLSKSVTITDAEYATYCGSKALNFDGVGITVFTTTDNETSVKLNEITSGKVPANTPVVLYKEGADGTAISVPVIASADAPEGTNDLHVVGAGGLTGEDNIFVLAKNPNVGFYLWDKTKTLNEGKIYLQGKASYSSSRQFLGFEENTTGIGTTLMNSERVNNGVYNLAGQRVAQPTKGLYIVNGKKVAIK